MSKPSFKWERKSYSHYINMHAGKLGKCMDGLQNKLYISYTDYYGVEACCLSSFICPPTCGSFMLSGNLWKKNDVLIFQCIVNDNHAQTWLGLRPFSASTVSYWRTAAFSFVSTWEQRRLRYAVEVENKALSPWNSRYSVKSLFFA